MKNKFFLLLVFVILISSIAIAKNPRHNQLSSYQLAVKFEEEPINDFQGQYHAIESDKLTPIEKLMEQANFCQISGSYMLVPNCATELDDDGSIPLDEIEVQRVYYLLRGDVIRYNRLEEEYNTPLKLKRFKESEDYKHEQWVMLKDRECLLDSTNTFYAICDDNAVFDLERAKFSFEIPQELCYYYGLILETTDEHFHKETFRTPIINEDTAYKIESNQTEIIVFVKLTGQARLFGAFEQIICKPTRFCIADKKTGEIYFDYVPKETPNEQETTDKSTHTETKEKVFEIVEVMPKFPGGDKALIEFISKNLKYPEKAAKEGIQGRVLVKFTVDKNGLIVSPCIIRGVSPELDAEAIRVFSLKNMPKWKPGTVNGVPVNVNYTFPLQFKLTN